MRVSVLNLGCYTLRRGEQIENLPKRDQDALLRTIDAFLSTLYAAVRTGRKLLNIRVVSAEVVVPEASFV